MGDEDAELARIARAEITERLAHAEDALLRLERHPTDRSALEELFREAHSLKGTARMAGLDALGDAAHAMEDRLALARRDGRLRVEDAGELLRRVDEMRALVAPRPLRAAPVAIQRVAPAAAPAPRVPAPEDAMRVRSKHLDAILDRTTELVILRGRIERLAEQLDRLADRVESQPDAAEDLQRAVGWLRGAAREDSARLAAASTALERTIREVRLSPLESVLGPFHRVVRDVAAAGGKRAFLTIEGGQTSLDRRVLDEVKDPLLHLVRNAVDHGLERPEERLATGKVAIGHVQLRAYADGANVVIEVEDDGRGFDVETIRRAAVERGLLTEDAVVALTPDRIVELAFLPGFSTAKRVTDVSGRGVGLDVVREAVERLKGTLRVENRPGRGATIRLRLPATTGTARVLLVQCAGRPYAIPLEAVLRVEPSTAAPKVSTDAAPVALARVLQLRDAGAAPGRAVVVLQTGGERASVIVDELLGEEEVVLKPHPPLLRRVRHVAGATILPSGDVCIILQPEDLVHTVRAGATGKRVLVVDDSATARASVSRLLSVAGFRTTAARDANEALALAAAGGFDAVVTDVHMPGMDGFALVRRLREDASYASTPILVVTSAHDEEHRRKAQACGASAFVAKGEGSAEALLAAVKRLLA